MLFVPLVLLAVKYLPPLRLWVLGGALILLAALGLLATIAYELATWYREMPEVRGQYLGRRILFVIGTRPQIPLVQILAAGICCWLSGKLRLRLPASNLASEE